MSFRGKLITFGLGLVAVLAVPVLYVEVRRPWQSLYELINQSRGLLDGVRAAFTEEDVRAMATFSVEMGDILWQRIPHDLEDADHRQWAHKQALNMLLDEGRLLPESQVTAALAAEKIEHARFSYDGIVEWYRFWEEEFSRRPGLEDTFRRYRRLLRQANASAVDGGFHVAAIYLAVDLGQARSGLYQEHLLFVLDSIHWGEATGPGDAYNLVETNTMGWRQAYDPAYGGQAGFNHNKVFDPRRWYLPQMDTDVWGTWFTSRYSEPVTLADGNTAYVSWSTDFNAAKVEAQMIHTAVELAVAGAIITLIIVIAARRFSRQLTRPIVALTEGAEAVMAHQYNHVVRYRGCDEFVQLIGVFNEMIQNVRRMVNLKGTLTKMLSAELAEKAAEEGLVLGGQHVACTLMFTDFAGFSSITRSLTPTETVELLNLYYGEMIPIIKQCGGFPDKYIGDAIVAIFGAPVRLEDHARRAVRCAIQMQKRIRQINDARSQRGQVIFEMRIGLNSGEVIVGAIGCDLKLEYTSIGETTNLANRMEAACPIGHVLMSADTRNQLDGQLDIDGATVNASPTLCQIKGYAQQIEAYGIAVHELTIEKNPEADDPRQFYHYSQCTKSNF